MAQWIRPQTPNREVLGSNLLAVAVVPLGKALYPHCPVPRKGLNPIETIVAFMRRAIAFLSGPWAHICDENKGFTQTPVTFLS